MVGGGEFGMKNDNRAWCHVDEEYGMLLLLFISEAQIKVVNLAFFRSIFLIARFYTPLHLTAISLV